MNKQEIIKKTEKFVKDKLYGEGTGHDWWHTLRVWQMAKKIGKEEGVDLFVVELASLLHDIADWKFQDGGDDSVGAMIAKEWLENSIKIIEDKVNNHLKRYTITKSNKPLVWVITNRHGKEFSADDIFEELMTLVSSHVNEAKVRELFKIWIIDVKFEATKKLIGC